MWFLKILGMIVKEILKLPGKFVSWCGKTAKEAFKKLDPWDKLKVVFVWAPLVVSIIIVLIWAYFESDAWDRKASQIDDSIIDPTWTVLVGLGKLLIVACICGAIYWFVKLITVANSPKNVEDEEDTYAVRKVVPLWQRLLDSRKNKGGNE